jgi:glycosyltransferase involved in cell wall biosynthesis
MHEFVDNGRTGFVVEQNSPEGIAGALRKIIAATPDQFSEYEKRCREWVVPFAWSTVVREHLAAYAFAG